MLLLAVSSQHSCFVCVSGHQLMVPASTAAADSLALSCDRFHTASLLKSFPTSAFPSWKTSHWGDVARFQAMFEEDSSQQRNREGGSSGRKTKRPFDWSKIPTPAPLPVLDAKSNQRSSSSYLSSSSS